MNDVAIEYLREINCSSSSTIEELIDGHYQRFIYCNTHLLREGRKPREERKPLPWSADQIFPLLQKEGFGYCFQLIECQLAALQWLNFPVTRHASFVLLQMHDDLNEKVKTRTRSDHPTHEVLLLHEGTDRWLIDVGFSYNALQGVLRCRDNEEAECGTNRYRVLVIDEEWRQLELLVNMKWLALYQYSLNPIDDCEFLSNGTFMVPQIVPIRDTLLSVGSVSLKERRFLRVGDDIGAVYKYFVNGSKVEEKHLTSWDEIKNLLLTYFPRVQCALEEIREHVCQVFKGKEELLE